MWPGGPRTRSMTRSKRCRPFWTGFCASPGERWRRNARPVRVRVFRQSREGGELSDEAIRQQTCAEPAPRAHLHGREGRNLRQPAGRHREGREPRRRLSRRESAWAPADARPRRRHRPRRIRRDLPVPRGDASAAAVDGDGPRQQGARRSAPAPHGVRRAHVRGGGLPQRLPRVQDAGAGRQRRHRRGHSRTRGAREGVRRPVFTRRWTSISRTRSTWRAMRSRSRTSPPCAPSTSPRARRGRRFRTNART